MRIVLGYPPSVAWRRKVLPWFSVRDLSACPRGAAVPLSSSVPCLRLVLCSSACVSPGGCPSFSQVGPAPSHWVPCLWTWLVWDASTVSFSYVFLRDVVTLWVNSVFLSLIIANEGLHWWLFLFRYSHPFWGRVIVFIRPH